MWETLAKAVIPVVLEKGLTEENIEKVMDFLIANGKKFSSKAIAYLEERKQRKAAFSDETQQAGIPAEVEEEIQNSFWEYLKEHSQNVYMGGIAFFCEKQMDDETQELLKDILTNANEDTDCIMWEDEEYAECQQIVDRFMEDNYGRSLQESQHDYRIDKDFLYLNLAFDDESDYYRLCDNASVRLLANALNRLLEDRYLTKFTIY